MNMCVSFSLLPQTAALQQTATSSRCFLLSATLPALILAKVLTAPMLFKLAIFWLGTSTTEQAAFPVLYSVLPSFFQRSAVLQSLPR